MKPEVLVCWSSAISPRYACADNATSDISEWYMQQICSVISGRRQHRLRVDLIYTIIGIPVMHYLSGPEDGENSAGQAKADGATRKRVMKDKNRMDLSRKDV